MAAIQGRLTVISIGGVALGKKTDASLTYNLSLIDTKNHDSSGFEEWLAGWKGVEISATMLWDDSDAGQEDVWDNITAGTSVAYDFTPQNSAGLHEITGTAFITSAAWNGSNDNAHGLAVTMKGTGAPTRTASQA